MPQINASRRVLRYGLPFASHRGSDLNAIAICVPIRNEQATLPDLLRALERLEQDRGDRIAICLLLDGCSDDSVPIASAYRDRSRHAVTLRDVAVSRGNAGSARHRSMLMGLDAIGDGEGWLLTTDGDSVPARDWLTRMKYALGASDLVAGRILRIVDTASPLQDRIERYYDRLFALRRQCDPVPWEAAITHHCTGGANIGIRAGVYRALGGFAPVPSGEDARLIDEAERAGMRVRRDATCVVRTSDRRDGRTAGGLAGLLRQLDTGDAADVIVAHPHDAAWQYRMHGVARSAHAEDRLDRIAVALGLTEDHVLGVARDCPNAQAFAMRIVPVPPAGMRRIGLAEAEAALRMLVDEREPA